jgi:hypothetical protein
MCNISVRDMRVCTRRDMGVYPLCRRVVRSDTRTHTSLLLRHGELRNVHAHTTSHTKDQYMLETRCYTECDICERDIADDVSSRSWRSVYCYSVIPIWTSKGSYPEVIDEVVGHITPILCEGCYKDVDASLGRNRGEWTCWEQCDLCSRPVFDDFVAFQVTAMRPVVVGMDISTNGHIDVETPVLVTTPRRQGATGTVCLSCMLPATQPETEETHIDWGEEGVVRQTYQHVTDHLELSEHFKVELMQYLQETL